MNKQPASTENQEVKQAHCCSSHKTTHKTAPVNTESNSAAIYTCPMHPEVRQMGQGICPKCGMGLEPLIADNSENEELTDMSKRFWTAVIFTIPVLVIAMGDLLPGQPITSLLGPKLKPWSEFIFAIPVCIYSAWPFYVRGYNSVISRNLNMFTLIAIGVFVAFGFSAFATIWPSAFPEGFRDSAGNIALYFETAAVIVTLVLLGQVLELKARSNTGSAIKKLLGLAPKTTRRVNPDGSIVEIPLDQVQLGDHLQVRPGEKVPVDGILIEGSSNLDESMISGEPMAVSKTIGSELIGATINGTGSFVMEATRIGADTLLSRIIMMVAEAQRSRAPIQKLADRVSSYFVPAVLISAVVTFILWASFGPTPALAFAILNSVAVLIIACPCALGLATPMSIMVATGRAAEMGILFRNAEAIEQLRKVDTLVVDKTGTLTLGKPKLVSLVPANSIDEAQLLGYAAALESSSEHPLASAIVEGAREKGLKIEKVDNFNSITGKGISATINSKLLFLGNLALMKENKITMGDAEATTKKLESQGQTVIYLSFDGKFLGQLGVADPVKETTIEAISSLQAAGIDVIMLTGDSETTALAVASKVGIAHVIAGVLPDKKAEAIDKLHAQGKIVAMAGDGINDAPALAKASVGIAMGTGTDIAMESAGVTLVKGDLRGILRAIQLSHATMRNIKQNLFFAFFYNILGVPIAAGALYPFFGILLSPIIAAAAMSLSSVSVISNSIRLMKQKLS